MAWIAGWAQTRYHNGGHGQQHGFISHRRSACRGVHRTESRLQFGVHATKRGSK